MTRSKFNWILLLSTNLIFICALSFYQTSLSAQKPARSPFSNAIEQRANMVRELQEIKTLLKEQNELLKAFTVSEKE